MKCTKRKGRRLTKKGKALLLCMAVVAFSFILSRCAPKKGEYIGTFDMSHYCLEQWGYYHMCGNSEYGYRGDELIPEKSLAVPKYLLDKYPVGTEVVAVYPDGREDILIIHDTGQALARLGRIDLPVRTHKEAMRRGVIKNVELYTLKK